MCICWFHYVNLHIAGYFWSVKELMHSQSIPFLGLYVSPEMIDASYKHAVRRNIIQQNNLRTQRYVHTHPHGRLILHSSAALPCAHARTVQ